MRRSLKKFKRHGWFELSLRAGSAFHVAELGCPALPGRGSSWVMMPLQVYCTSITSSILLTERLRRPQRSSSKLPARLHTPGTAVVHIVERLDLAQTSLPFFFSSFNFPDSILLRHGLRRAARVQLNVQGCLWQDARFYASSSSSCIATPAPAHLRQSRSTGIMDLEVCCVCAPY